MKRTIFHISLAIYSFFYVVPLIWMLLSSFKDNGAIFDNPFALPKTWNLGVFLDAWEQGGLGKYILNSAIVTSLATSISLFVASLAAFAFSRFEFFLKKQLLPLFVLGLLLPIQAYFIAQNEIFEFFGLKDHRWTLVLPYAGLAIPLANPGFKSGAAIIRYIPKSELPSIFAASNNSFGNESKYAFNNQD